MWVELRGEGLGEALAEVRGDDFGESLSHCVDLEEGFESGRRVFGADDPANVGGLNDTEKSLGESGEYVTISGIGTGGGFRPKILGSQPAA